MSKTPHDLVEEFPEFQDQIHLLKISDPHAVKLFDKYHKVNHDIYQAETNLAPTDDFHMTQMRKERMVLKDEIAKILNH